MSQYPYQNNGLLEIEQSLAYDSQTIGRNQSSSSQSPAQDSSSYRSQRKAAPSPLQTSTTATSPGATPTRSTFTRPPADSRSRITETRSYTPQNSDQPRSPKERLDDLLASEKSFYIERENSLDTLASDNTRAGKFSNTSNGASRSVSDPILNSKTKPERESPTNTQPSMATAAPSYRIDMARGPPRTSSIDSAISSISAGGHSYKSSGDSHGPGSTSPDIANLIQAAGSSEAVIQYLLKEKQSQAAQNTQLWRLVDKQRSMILGLNKDLERALKDKERYRKKLKETIAQIPGASGLESTSGSIREKSSVPSKPSQGQPTINVEALVVGGLRDHNDNHDDVSSSPIDVAGASYPMAPPAGLTTTKVVPLANMVEAERKMPTPSQHAFQRYDVNAPVAGFEAGRHQRKVSGGVQELPYNASAPPSRSLPANPPPRNPVPSPLSTIRVPEFNFINPSSNVDHGEPNFPSPPRKPPPAPLNLGKPSTTSSHLHQAESPDDDESDYDDVLEVEEIPSATERGRRKTREEDDKEREVAAMRDAELRSLSKKSKSKDREKVPEINEYPMPPSVKQAVQISPPDAQTRLLSPEDSTAGSLAGMLSASGPAERAAEGSQQISLPPMSPGLPLSPRPSGMSVALPRNPHAGSSQSSLASPPMSARGMGAFPSAMPLSPRAPRQPIPLPPNTPMSMISPEFKIQPPEYHEPMTLQDEKSTLDLLAESPTESSPITLNNHAIYQGFTTDEHPGLLLPPNALPSIDVRVASSRLKPSRASIMFPSNFDEDPVFTLAIFARSNGQELWRVEKDSMSLTRLDQVLRVAPQYVAKVPEKSLFAGHAPAKIDARRAALDRYFDEILNTQMDMDVALEVCRYLSSNTMEPHADDNVSPVVSRGESPLKTGPGGRSIKNGYLTKRGKNFGGWKARFFVLDGPVFKYYEAPGGAHLGTIKLQSAQIGKQQSHSDNQSPSRGDVDDPENQYRHAFLILEPKRKDSSSLVRHVLCAESDKERDQWVEALLQYVDYRDSEDDELPYQLQGRMDSVGSNHTTGSNAKKKMYGPGKALNVLDDEDKDSLRGISYETTRQGEIPQGAKKNPKSSGTPPPAYEGDHPLGLPQSQSSLSISAPKNAVKIEDSGAWGNKPSLLAPAFDDKKKERKRSFFGFGSSKPRSSSDIQDHGNDITSSLSQMSFEQHGPIRAVFGAPLAEAVRFNHPVDTNIELPAVVYRCIEYLDHRNAASEEGIFRLSGSNVVIKALRERFNLEGDVNLITDEQYYDIHAVASLLKLYLRELPTTILTRDLHLDFLAVTEIHDLDQKIRTLNELVYKLPKVNGTLLRYLSSFLINIINHSDVNKMTVRNVGIVFSPTLNIPAPVFALFLQQYDGIFDSEPAKHEDAPEITVTASPTTPDDIRSPRKQQFQELPTPSYDQQSFQRAPAAFPHMGQQAQPNRAMYDTGFTPLQPTYEAYPTTGGPEYGSLNGTIAGPAYEQFAGARENSPARQYLGEQTNQGSSKAKRRESSMFNMGMGVSKKPSNTRLNDSRLVDEESNY